MGRKGIARKSEKAEKQAQFVRCPIIYSSWLI